MFSRGNVMVFFLTFSLMAFSAESAERQTSSQKIDMQNAILNQPLSNVWDWKVPHPELYVQGSLRTYLLDDGDVLILYSQRKIVNLRKSKVASATNNRNLLIIDNAHKDNSKLLGSKNELVEIESKQVTFFAGLTIANEPSNIKLMRTPEKTIKLENGTTARILKSDWDKGSGELKDNTYIVSHCDSYQDCYVGPAKCVLTRYKDKNYASSMRYRENMVASKVVFMLLDKPKIWRGAYSSEIDECNERDHKLKVRVEALSGHVLALSDGTFLLVDNANGRIVRFNEDLSTGSHLANTKIFIFDFNVYERDTRLFMPELNGNKYNDNNGNVKMQEVIDDLYSYLAKLGKGGK